jgi:hypothetical protein
MDAPPPQAEIQRTPGDLNEASPLEAPTKIEDLRWTNHVQRENDNHMLHIEDGD